MPANKRLKTQYPGVYYIESTIGRNGKPERVYYIFYRGKDGKQIEEKAGRQYADDMTPARAAGIRSRRMQGKELSNRERREVRRAGKRAEATKWTIGRLWKHYKANKSLKGIAQDESRYNNYIKPLFADKEPADILPLDIDRLRRKKLKGKSAQTVKLTLALLRRIVNYAAKRQMCAPLPFSIEMPKVNSEQTEILTKEQLKDLLKALDKSEDIQAANIMRMALFTGMRRGELFKLKWDDIDFERGFIHIRAPKSGQDQEVPLNDAARRVLENHPSSKRSKSTYVFPGRRGKKRTDIKKAVNKIKKAACLPKDFRPLHGLRHVYASLLASSGKVDMYTLQKLLTHKSPQMTQRYAHLSDKSLRRASDLAGELIEQAVKEDRNKVSSSESSE
jgi:integrase